MRYILLMLWLVLGLGYFLLARYCGHQEIAQASDASNADNKIATTEVVETPCPPTNHFYFNWSSEEIITKDSWSDHLKTMLGKMEETSKIRITGLYINKETNNSSFENLGMARAKAMAAIIGLEEDKYQFGHDSMRNVKYSMECPLPAVNIRLVTVSEKIKEIDDRTLIYFPVNSVNKLADEEVEKYLDDVAERVNKTGEIIKLDGHADNSGNVEHNFKLGERRADIIKQYLLSKNVLVEKIQTESFGDSRPIATNETEEGRAENRRTELRIINENLEK